MKVALFITFSRQIVEIQQGPMSLGKRYRLQHGTPPTRNISKCSPRDISLSTNVRSYRAKTSIKYVSQSY